MDNRQDEVIEISRVSSSVLQEIPSSQPLVTNSQAYTSLCKIKQGYAVKSTPMNNNVVVEEPKYALNP